MVAPGGPGAPDDRERSRRARASAFQTPHWPDGRPRLVEIGQLTEHLTPSTSLAEVKHAELERVLRDSGGSVSRIGAAATGSERVPRSVWLAVSLTLTASRTRALPLSRGWPTK